MKQWEKLEIEVISFKEIQETIVSASGSWCKGGSCGGGGGMGCGLAEGYCLFCALIDD